MTKNSVYRGAIVALLFIGLVAAAFYVFLVQGRATAVPTLSETAMQKQQQLVAAVDAGEALFIRVESYVLNREMAGLASVSYPDRIVIETTISTDAEGKVVYESKEYTMNRELLTSGIMTRGRATVTAAGSGEVFTYTMPEVNADLGDWINARFAVLDKLQSGDWTQRETEGVGGQDIYVFDATSTTPFGKTFKSVLKAPKHNPLLLESLRYEVRDGQEILVGHDRHLEVATR